jgi:hypothetical protein
MPDSCNPTSHLVPLADGWSLWRTICLRGAGFPIDLLEKLVPQGLEAKVERLLQCDEEYQRALGEALDLCCQRTSICPDEMRQEWRRALRRLRKGRAPGSSPADSEAEKLFAKVSRTIEAREAAQRDLSGAYPAAREEVTGNLKELCDMPLFREALIWQNRAFVKTGVDVLARRDVSEFRRKTRETERKVASYLQRYACKNDSIGFFGPIGWAEIAPTEEGVHFQTGAGLVSKRLVSFEHWAIHSLTQQMSKDEEMLAWMHPRQHTDLRLHGDHFILPNGDEGDLDPAQRALLDASDGLTPAREIALRLAAELDFPISEPPEILKRLGEMVETGLLIWRLETPNVLSAEKDLRDRLGQIGDETIRMRALGQLDTLVAAKDRVAAAAGDAEALDEAMGNLEQVFSDLTGVPPNRYEGRTYAGRTLVYEDCQRDIDVTIDESVLEPLRESLVPILEATRWYSHAVSQKFKQALAALYEKQCQKRTTTTLDLEPLWPKIFELTRRASMEAGKELGERLAQLLPLPPGERQIEFDLAEFRTASAELFAAPDPGWPRAKRHSPDIMIAAESPQAIARGEAQFILGEIHTCRNTIMQPALLTMHPNPERTIEEDISDRAGFRVTGANPPGLGGSRASIDFSHDPDDYHFCSNEALAQCSPEKTLLIGDLILEKVGPDLRLKSRDGSQDIAFEDFVGFFVRYWSPKCFSLKPEGSHVPRITIGKLVFCRETWRFTADDMPFAHLNSPEERFSEARRWQEKHGLPRRIFVKAPQENKPFYVDHHSPLSIEMFTHSIRQAHTKMPAELITISEMLPTPDQTWLLDADGNRYTSELRIVAVDPMNPSPPDEIPAHSKKSK